MIARCDRVSTLGPGQQSILLAGKLIPESARSHDALTLS